MDLKKANHYYKPYWFLASIRIFLVFVPQTGYIHPDEYFQTVEVLAGRIFEFEASLPWEFNVTSPIRSIGVPYFTIGLSYKILQTLDAIIKLCFNVSIITPYFLLVIPRLFLCLMSFCIDFCLYNICVINNEKYKSRLLILSSSFVIIVYGTRTFTNTIEMFLFAVLLYYVAESMTFSNIIVRQSEYINKRYNKAKSPAERAKFHKLRLFLASHSFRNCLHISTVAVLGFFNRPTFICYATLPVFFWLYRGIGYQSVTTMLFHVRIIVLILSAIPTIVLLILVDSFFYGYISWGEIGVLDISINSFVFPPLNFLKYNVNTENLSKHGLHPRYLHVLINVPLLFNILGFFGIFGIADMTVKLLKRKFHLLPTVRSIRGLMTVSYIAPIFGLSIFPHQEPRFLLPVIVPLVYLYSNNIYRETDFGLVKLSRDTSKKEILDKKPHKETSYLLFNLWLLINLLCCFYFGFLQQGGVYRATQYLSNEVNSKPYFNYHIVSSHIYSIPHIFFMQPNSEKIFSQNNSKYQVNKHIFTYEKGSKDLSILLNDVLSILQLAAIDKRRYKLYLLISGSIKDKFENITRSEELQSLNVQHKIAFYPHLSTEAMPDFSEFFNVIVATIMNQDQFSCLFQCIYKIITSFSLDMYEITLQNSLII